MSTSKYERMNMKRMNQFIWTMKSIQRIEGRENLFTYSVIYLPFIRKVYYTFLTQYPSSLLY